MKKLQEQEKRQKVEFRKRVSSPPRPPKMSRDTTPLPLTPLSPPQMEQEVSAFIQASGEPRRRFQPMNKIERSIL